eukprot:scaffold2510_cov169-Amphora_coffeaeformis.AAC.26
MDGRTDNRTHSMTTHFLKAPHQQKPEPLSLQLAYLQWKLHNTWVPMYYINPNVGLPHVLRSKPRSTPDKRGRKHGSHSFGQSPRYRVAEIKSVKAFLEAYNLNSHHPTQEPSGAPFHMKVESRAPKGARNHYLLGPCHRAPGTAFSRSSLKKLLSPYPTVLDVLRQSLEAACHQRDRLPCPHIETKSKRPSLPNCFSWFIMSPNADHELSEAFGAVGTEERQGQVNGRDHPKDETQSTACDTHHQARGGATVAADQ